MKRSISNASLLLAVVLLSTISLDAQKGPDDAVGFDPAKTYQFLDTDTVSLYNGNVLINLPIGNTYPVSPSLRYGLTLSYNSLGVWDYEDWEICEDEDTCSLRGPEGFPSFRSNASPGWRLSLGRLFAPDEPSMPDPYRSDEPGAFVYEGPTGDEHAFRVWDTGYTANTALIARTGSEDHQPLRLTWNPSVPNERYVEFASGEVHRFELTGAAMFTPRWRLRGILDRYGNWVLVDYEWDQEGREAAWIIRDSLGRWSRVAFVHFSQLADSFSEGQNVQSVTLGTVGGGTSEYQFTYTTQQLAWGCRHERRYDDGAVPTSLPMLSSVTLPDGSSFEFQYHQTGESCEQGAIKRITYPTRGWVEYTYQPYGFATENICDEAAWTNIGPMYGAAGIKTRTINDGTTSRVWEYLQRRGPSLANRIGWSEADPCVFGDEGGSIVGPFYWSRTSVLTPANEYGRRNRSDHYFDIYKRELLTISAGGYNAKNHTPADAWAPTGLSTFGLRENTVGAPPNICANASPYLVPETEVGWPGDLDARDSLRFTTPAGARYLATHSYENCDATGDCTTGRLVKSSYTNYEQTSFGLDLESARTVWESDTQCSGVACWTAAANSAYDGAGHYGTTTSVSNFPGTPDRTVNTAYRVWSAADLLHPSEPFITGLYTAAARTEGGTTLREQFDFDPATGFLRRHRVLAGGSAASNDILKVFVPNAEGAVGFALTYGGDEPSQALGTGNLSALALPGTPWYKIGHDYSYGVLASSRFYERTTGTPLSFKTVDRTIDFTTGLVTSARDASGVETRYEYDDLGRLTRIIPTGAGQTGYAYVNASVPGLARVDVTRYDSAGNAVLGQERFTFDGLGRVRLADRYVPTQSRPAGEWIRTETQYNEVGQTARVSVPFSILSSPTPPSFTTYRFFDAFGRATSVLAPDGAETILQFDGERIAMRSETVQTQNGPMQVSRTETYDGWGRLVAVTEPAGALYAGFFPASRLAIPMTPAGGSPRYARTRGRRADSSDCSYTTAAASCYRKLNPSPARRTTRTSTPRETPGTGTKQRWASSTR